MAVKLVVSSDWHLDAVTAGVPRLPDLRASIRAIMAHIRDLKKAGHEVYFAFLGDLCDPYSGFSVWGAVSVAISFLADLTLHGIDSFWIAGNHDVIENKTGFTTLSPLRSAATLTGLSNSIGNAHVFTEPLCVHFKSFDILALPFTSRFFAYDPAKEASKAISHRTRRDSGGTTPPPLIVLGHLHLQGIIPGEESTDMARGREVMFPIDELTGLDNTILLNGHYHRAQTYRGVMIPGALQRLTFGEEGHNPGFLEITVGES